MNGTLWGRSDTKVALWFIRVTDDENVRIDRNFEAISSYCAIMNRRKEDRWKYLDTISRYYVTMYAGRQLR